MKTSALSLLIKTAGTAAPTDYDAEIAAARPYYTVDMYKTVYPMYAGRRGVLKPHWSSHLVPWLTESERDSFDSINARRLRAISQAAKLYPEPEYFSYLDDVDERRRALSQLRAKASDKYSRDDSVADTIDHAVNGDYISPNAESSIDFISYSDKYPSYHSVVADYGHVARDAQHKALENALSSVDLSSLEQPTFNFNIPATAYNTNMNGVAQVRAPVTDKTTDTL